MTDIGTGLTAIGAGIAIGAAALGTGMAQKAIGAAGMGLMAEKEGKDTMVIILLALPETVAILGFVIAFLLLGTIGK
jgi:V/A-type H+-transporting ATPase subunit K